MQILTQFQRLVRFLAVTAIQVLVLAGVFVS